LPLSPLLLPTRALRYSSRFETGRKQGARFGQNTEGVTETCKQGHELSSANLYISPKGRHFCRKCKALYARAYGKRECHSDPLTASAARSEAAALFRMIGRNGETVDSIRDLVRVDRDSMKALLGFLAVHPKEFRWVMEALNFRDLVLEKFDHLTKRKESLELVVAAEAEAARRQTLKTPIPPLLQELVVMATV
jgi:hypothetical protein